MKPDTPTFYGVNDSPTFILSVFLGLQYLFLNLPSILLPGILISRHMGLGPGPTEYILFSLLLVAAVSTLIQVLRIGRVGSGYFVVMGPSGAFIGCSLAAVDVGGLSLLATLTALSALVEVAGAAFLRHIRTIITPAVGGTVVVLVAILVIPLLIPMITGNEAQEYAKPSRLITAALTAVLTLAFAMSRIQVFRLWGPLLGLCAGIAAAAWFGMLDFSPLAAAPLVALPRGSWPGLEWRLGLEHLPLFIAFAVATLSSMLETVGDYVATQKVSEPSRKKIDYDRLQGCLYSDAVGSLLGGLTGTVSNTSYSNNIPVIEITRVASRRVAFCFVGLLAAFAFLPRLAYFITTVPDPVLGGSGLAIMALLAGIGLKTIAEDSSNPTEKYLLAGISISIGLVSAEQSLFGAFLPSSSLTFFNNALSTGALTAIGLSTYFRFRPKKTRSLILPADMDQFPVLKQTVDEVCEAFSLGEQATFRLHLACEELFALLLQDSEASRRITFTFTAEEHLVLVEVRDRSSIEDVDELSARESTSHDELIAGRGLGLILLNKIAESVRHDRISGYNYIQFSIPFQG